MTDPCLIAGEHVDGCIYTGGNMTRAIATKDTKAATTTDKRGPGRPRHPSAGSLLKTLNDYMKREDVGSDASIGTVIGKLEATIVAEDQAKR